MSQNFNIAELLPAIYIIFPWFQNSGWIEAYKSKIYFSLRAILKTVVMDKKLVTVTCAIIVKGNRIFAAQRAMHKKHGGKWEFPGGKQLYGETLQQCLARELKEELLVDVQVKQSMEAVMHNYIDFRIALHPFLCALSNETVTPTEHKQVGWFSMEELLQMDFTDADRVLIHRIKKAGGVPAIGEQR